MKNLWFKYYSLLLSYPSKDWLYELENIERYLEKEKNDFFKFSQFFKNFPLQELQEEYTNLFISSFPTLPCPPYESYYREGLLLGETSQEVLDYYEKTGFQFFKEGEALIILLWNWNSVPLPRTLPLSKELKIGLTI